MYLYVCLVRSSNGWPCAYHQVPYLPSSRQSTYRETAGLAITRLLTEVSHGRDEHKYRGVPNNATGGCLLFCLVAATREYVVYSIAAKIHPTTTLNRLSLGTLNTRCFCFDATLFRHVANRPPRK